MNNPQYMSSQTRTKVIILQILVYLLAPCWLLKTVHFFYYPLPLFFGSPSLIPNPSQVEKQNVTWVNSLINISLFFLFYLQHIIMASLQYKKFCYNLTNDYAVYQRLVYNIVSSILLLIVLEYQTPYNKIMFELPLFFCLPIAVIGVLLFMDSNLRMDVSILQSFSLKRLFTQKNIEIKNPNYEKKQTQGITIKGSFAFIRHPMQSGCILSLTFGNTVFTLQKLIIMAVMITGIFIGVCMEQKRLAKKFTQYEEYMKVVKARFIPYLL